MNKVKIEDYLLENGFKPNLLGFSYLVTAIQLYEPESSICDLYDTIAHQHNTAKHSVERSINHSIRKALQKNVKNAEFIATTKLLVRRKDD